MACNDLDLSAAKAAVRRIERNGGVAMAPAPLRPGRAARTIACRLRGRPRLRPGTKEFP